MGKGLDDPEQTEMQFEQAVEKAPTPLPGDALAHDEAAFESGVDDLRRARIDYDSV